jgi:iron-sulfur cluster repair protein YtfE (RIC family)
VNQAPNTIDPTRGRPDLPEFLAAYTTMHDSMTRDARRLTTLSGSTSLVDHDALARWWNRYQRVIVNHHVREDAIVFPALEARATDAMALAQLRDEHEQLDQAMAALSRAIGDHDAGALPPAATRFAEILDDHLRFEEEVVFPALDAQFTAEEFGEIEKSLSKGTKLGDVAFELPWALDGASDDLREFAMRMVPAPFRVLNRVVWEPRYERISAVVRRDAR